ncbi:MAG: hypothetical protein OET46_03685 [Xanthomonadales bacterium]|jgi:hypothetical protein|nr:hypothetical protein [Xanthomonadales bacterium]
MTGSIQVYSTGCVRTAPSFKDYSNEQLVQLFARIIAHSPGPVKKKRRLVGRRIFVMVAG